VSKVSFLYRQCGSAMLVVFLNAAMSGCETRAASAEAKNNAAAGGIIDRSMPIEDALRQFQRDIPRVDSLAWAARSRDALVADFMRALERGDSTRLVQLFISKREFAWLYFPTSLYMSKPYELPPEIAWLLTVADSEKGFKRLTRRLGGRALHYSGVDCERRETDSRHAYWRDCFVSYSHPGEGRVRRRLFGSIMERDGRYKFLSYANDF
jgi:hypothetical protein